MSEEAQTGLGDYADEATEGSGSERKKAAGSGDRIVEEAIAVAGNGGSGRAEVVDVVAETLPEPQGALELAVMQVDYTIAGRGNDERPVMHVFGRTEDGEIEHVRVVGFKPYFYAPTASLEGPPEERYDRLTGSETEDEDGEPYESIRGEKLTKIFGQTPRDVGQVRDEFDHYEADILFPNRFLIDKDVRSGIRVPERRADDGSLVVPHDEVKACEVEADPRVCTFDIEVDDRSGFPEDGEEPIVCLTSHDSVRDEYVMWLYEAPIGEGPIPDEITAYEPIDGEIDHEVRAFEEEEAMLEAFVDYVRTTDPDVITGWNCLPADSDVLMADGTEKEIRNVEIGDEVVGSESQQTTVTEVTNKWESEKSIREFSLADGTSLRSSDDHRIMVGDDDSVGWKAGNKVESGDYVLKPRRLSVEETHVPTLADLVPGECQRYAEKQTISEFKEGLPYGAISELADTFDVSVGTLHHPHTTVWTPGRCRKTADQYDVPVPDGGVEYRGTGVDLDRKLTPEELYYAGLILADGSISSEEGIRFYNTKEELHYQFPGENHLESDGKGCYKQNVLDYATMYAFNGLGIPFGNKNDGDIDLSAVYELPTEYIGRFLAGAIDGDGNIAESGITVAAENRSIGEWYVKLFKRLGIYAQQRENVVRIPDAKRDINRLTNYVLPHMAHPEKKLALEAFEGGKSGGTENIPYALFEANVGTDAKRIGNDKHRRGINLKRHETSSDEWEDYVFVEVTDVSVTGTETTYDIETTTHNFIAEGCLVHNCDDFDAPYFLDRLERLQGPHHDYDLDIDRLSRVDEVWRSNWGGPDIKGRVVFDLLYGYQRMVISELDSYRLDAVGEAELGVGKERYAGDIGDLWEDDPTQLLEYNLRDVELCVELDRQQNIVPFWDEVRAFVGCKLEDAPTPGDAVDMYVLHEAHGRFALPSKGRQEGGEEYEGGAVFDPITGVKENVTVLDLKSLYPMCMVTVNASPETRVDPERYDGATHTAPTTPEPTHFRQEPDGIIREMVNELLAEREEKKELRNQHDSGSSAFEQYDRQQGAVKVIMNCFTPDTEVLTPDGVRDITDLEVGDDVYSLDPETKELQVKPVVETHSYPDYEGDLIDIETGKIDFSVTPNHRMLVRKNETNGITDDEYRFVEAGNLDRATNYELPHDWEGPDGDELEEIDLTDLIDGEYEVWVRPSIHGHTFTAELGWTPRRVPKADVGETGYVFTAEEFEDHREYIEEVCETSFVHRESGRKWIPRTYDGDDFLDLLAWFVTEGNVYTSEDKQFGENFRGSATTVKLAQENLLVADGGSNHHATIGDLLDGMGFDSYVNDRSYTITSKLLGNLLTSLCGDGSFEKRIPEFVFDCSRRQKRRFLDLLVDGDGDRQINSWRYSTSSNTLRDDVLRLCAHLGFTANYSRDSETWRIYVTENSKNTLRMHRGSSRSTAENGVYCVTVEDNHTLLAGRNGKFQFVGQSLYGVSGWEQFRLYDKDAASAITATGREVIEFTEEAANELNYQVSYGDTDSVMLELGPEVSKEEAIEQSFDIEEHINDRYDDFARDVLNAEDHRFQIEFEKLYRRFFQAGKKKRYAGHITWKEGKDVDTVDIVGFEYQRSDIAPITKEVQHRVIEMIVKDGDVEGAKEYLHGIIEQVRTGEVSVEEIGIPGGIGKRLDDYDTDTAQVRGAKYANRLLGTNFQRGSKPKRLYLKRVDPAFFRRVEAERDLDARQDPLYGEFKRDPDVICFEYADQLPEEFEVDYDKMLEKTLKGPIARILEALGISWEEIKSGQEQTGLDSFI